MFHNIVWVFLNFCIKYICTQIDWMLYFDSFMNGTIDKHEEIVTFATEYMSKMAKLVQNTDDKYDQYSNDSNISNTINHYN